LKKGGGILIYWCRVFEGGEGERRSDFSLLKKKIFLRGGGHGEGGGGRR